MIALIEPVDDERKSFELMSFPEASQKKVSEELDNPEGVIYASKVAPSLIEVEENISNV